LPKGGGGKGFLVGIPRASNGYDHLTRHDTTDNDAKVTRR
jgi:hypothetical protein